MAGRAEYDYFPFVCHFLKHETEREHDAAEALLVSEGGLDVLGNRIGRVHVKDFRTIVGNINGFVDLLSGDANFPAVMHALRETGYDGYLTAEMNGFPCQSDAVVVHTLDALTRMLSY